MKVPPYKFGLLVTQEDMRQNRVWSTMFEAWQQEEPVPGARFGGTLREGMTTFRLDVDSSYFRPDSKHWVRHSVREEIKKLFKNLPPFVTAECSLVLIWTDDSSWLSLDAVRKRMEVWKNGRGSEPRELWELVRTAPKWGP